MAERLTRSEWAKTPYAKTQAQNPDGAIQKLLERYGVEDVQWTQGRGKTGRRALLLRFVLNGRGYRISLEVLDADASPEELLAQIKRVMFFSLKTSLELASVFITAEELLFWALELKDGATAYEVAGPNLGMLSPPDFMAKLLPPRRD